MKTLTKTLAALALATGAAAASAAPILNISGQGLAAAQAAEAAFLGTLNGGYITEYFDSGYTVGAQSTSINSVQGVGTFTSNIAGVGGACDNGAYNCADGLAVLDDGSTPFSGRFDVSQPNWLDSMDAQSMTFAPAAGYNAMGFFMTDPNDAGGRFSIGGVDFSFANIFGGALGNGRVFYISLYDEDGLSPVTIYTNNRDDGYGLDNVTVGNVQVSEPGTLALFALGLFGLGVARKRLN